jgi:glutamine cyclotransferase
MKRRRMPLPALLLLLLVIPLSSQSNRDQSYKIVHTYPHDRGAFTQGLLFHDGFLYEGTGMEGHSGLRKVKLETGDVVQEKTLPPPYFGEGIVIFGNKLYEITWQSKICFVYDLQTFKSITSYVYNTEGWGLTTDGKRLIMSDGTETIYFRDPETFKETGKIEVRDHGKPIEQLNELEWVEGEIYANVWKTERVVRISPKDGHVIGWIDLTGLRKLAAAEGEGDMDVLNGIAYDAATKRLFVTGKRWPKLFEIKLEAAKKP